jgi:hypothetical protein
MTANNEREQSRERKGALDKFEAGGDLGPVEDRSEYEQRMNSLPAEQKELAQESTRLADLCQYFSQQSMDVPPAVLERVGRLPALTIAERVRATRDINQTLMEYLNDVGQDPGIRQ